MDDVARKQLTTHDITGEPPSPIAPCRMVLNNSVRSNMTCSHKPVLLSVCRLYFSASFQDCASGSTLRWTTKMPDKGTIQRFNVNSSHLPLQLLNLKAGGKKKSVKPATAIVLIFPFFILLVVVVFFVSSDIRLIFFSSVLTSNTFLPYPNTCQCLFFFLGEKAYYFPL